MNLEWIHPILQKDIPELLSETKDTSDCKVVQSLESPLRKISLEQFNYVAFEGNIGAGKTTLANIIGVKKIFLRVFELYGKGNIYEEYWDPKNINHGIFHYDFTT